MLIDRLWHLTLERLRTQVSLSRFVLSRTVYGNRRTHLARVNKAEMKMEAIDKSIKSGEFSPPFARRSRNTTTTSRGTMWT